MRILLIITLLVCFGGAEIYSQNPPPPLIYQAPIKSDLKEFISKDNSFQITFAGDPKIEESQLSNGILYKSYKVYRKGSTSTVNTLDYSSKLENKDQIYELFKAGYLKQPKTKLESESNLKLDGIDGKELNFSLNLKYLKVVILVHESRIYIFECDVTNWHILSDEKKRDFFNESSRFLNSFKQKSVDAVVMLDLDTFIGSTVENEYKNNFFGFSLKFPQDWTTLTKDEIASVMDVGLNILKTDNESKNKAFELVARREVIIFIAAQRNEGVERGSSLSIGVTKQPNASTTPKMVAIASKSALELNENIEILDEIKEREINGTTFAIINLRSMSMVNLTIFITMKKGYSITFSTGTTNQDNKQVLERIIGSLQFK